MFRSTSVECPDVGRARPRQETLTYEIDVITPLFGGGESPGVNDSISLIRPSEIKGHLRFWWRATRGSTAPDVVSLYRDEARIWGGFDGDRMLPSKVSIHVPEIKPGVSVKWSRGFLSNHRPVTVRSNVHFTLEVTLPADLVTDVEAAIWAWTSFGGIGARTRRACGSLYCKKRNKEPFVPSLGTAEPNEYLKQWIREASLKYGFPVSTNVRPWPTLAISGSVKLMGSIANARDELLECLRSFRQEPEGRNAAFDPKSTPGRSKWPEADSVRMISGNGEERHMRSLTVNAPAFPRAALGLPLELRFEDENRKGFPHPRRNKATGNKFDRDSSNNCIIHAYYNGMSCRMASPVLLRPFKTGDDKALAVVLRLNTTGLQEVYLASRNRRLNRKTYPSIRGASLALYPGSPMGKNKEGKVRSEAGCAVEAFLSYLQEQEFAAL